MAINRDKVEAQAIKLLQQGKLDKAIIELKKIVEHDPTDVRTLLKMGDTYVKLGAKKESVDAYEKAASIYTEQGFFLKAVAVYKQILRVDASPAGLHLKLAELYQQLGLVNDALQHYQNVAISYEQNGKPKESLEILRRMVDLDPDNLASRIKLAELFAQQGHGVEAVNELRSALLFLKTQQRFDDYLRVGEKLVAYDASALDVAKELAQIYMQRGQANVALSKLQLCFKADPRNLDVLSMIAAAFLAMDQVPKTVSVYKEIAKIHAADDNAELAQQTWERVLELQPGDEEANAALGHSPTMLRAPQIPTMVAPAMANAPVVSTPQRPSVEDEQLARLLTETDVYAKYGLKEKAVEHLQKVFAIRADYVPALEKLARLLQPTGGPPYVDALRDLVAAAEGVEHPSLAQWRSELVGAAAARVATVARPVPMASAVTATSAHVARSSLSDDGEEILVDDPSQSNLVLDELALDDASGALSLDDSMMSQGIPDEPFGGGLAPAPLPPDEELGAPRAIPRLPTGILSSPAAPQPPPAPLTDEISGGDADAIVRQALRDISDADVEAAAELVLSDEQPAVEEALELVAEDELDITAKGTTFPVDDELDRIAQQAVAEAQASVAAPARGADVAATAMMSFTTAELEEIREFDDGTGATAPIPAVAPRPSTGWSAAAGRIAEVFGEQTLALVPNRSSDVPTDERPKRAPPALVSTPASVGPGLADASDDDDLRTMAVVGFGALRTAPDRSSAAPSAVPQAAPAPVLSASSAGGTFDGELSEEFDPSSFDLPSDVKEMLRRPVAAAPAAPVPASTSPAAVATLGSVALDDPSLDLGASRDRLGLKAKAQGFENDPANQFFHDELEESEFFIQQELLDEAKEILTAILDDVPDSARVQWMLARIEAKEQGQPEPAAPWEQRILEEVQAQLENLGLEEAVGAPEAEPATLQISVDEVLSQFKQKVAEVIPAEDAATHYELGNAYRDMGLLDDAVAEFLVAARNPGKAADARYLIGLTRLDQGRVDEAIDALEAAVGTPGASRTQRGASNYQLGLCLEQSGRGPAALAALKAAKADGHVAADLDRRIKALIDKHGDDGANGHGKQVVAVSSTRAKNIDYV
ncbi:MAG: tetratricopeptide repeat protein [Deltaproteobacteria bacterium]|nr:tetratricopeptide repeat protein [Deltaproteobacteria bacterium]